MNGKMRPREAIQNLKKAKLRGEDVVGRSMKRTSLLFLESRRGSLDATMSHLKAWHFFALTALGYFANCNLHPRCAIHVLCFLIFLNMNSGANCLGTIRWACKLRGL